MPTGRTHMHRIYTRHGDRGTTTATRRDRRGKDNPRVMAYGGLYELNAHLGLARAAMAAVAPTPDRPAWASLSAGLAEIQHRLFFVGRDLSQSRGLPDHELPLTLAEHVLRLEALIDQLAADTPPWRPFTIPGGSLAAGHLFVATTVCRRAETLIAALHHEEPVPDAVLAWVNRLSDLLFVAARCVNGVEGVVDPPLRDPVDGY